VWFPYNKEPRKKVFLPPNNTDTTADDVFTRPQKPYPRGTRPHFYSRGQPHPRGTRPHLL